MARLIIVLDRQDMGGDVGFRVAFWANVPAARQSFYADAARTSQVKDATAGELAALRNGSVTERVDVIRFPTGTTLNQAQTGLVAAFNAYQSEVNAYNPWNRYGTFWDGTSWTAGGVA